MPRKPRVPNYPRSPSQSNVAAAATLATLDQHLRDLDLPPIRRRDLRSATARVASLLQERPENLPLDLALIASGLKTINPVAAGMTAKRLSNIRSDFMAAVRLSRLRPIPSAQSGLSPAWVTFMNKFSTKRTRIGLSRLARYASRAAIAPDEINDEVLAQFVVEVRNNSLHQNPNILHRKTAVIWNEAVSTRPELGLQSVSKPTFRGPPKRIDWALLTEEFRSEVEEYLTWCAGEDAFAADARPKALKPRTLKLRRNQIHAAVTALANSGVETSAIGGLADLASPDHFRRILRNRHANAGQQINAFNRDLAEALVQIAREWVNADSAVLAQLKVLTGKVPMPKSGLTAKNKKTLRQFEDPAALLRMFETPQQLWREVKRASKPNFRTLAKAQAAIGIAILNDIPLRPQNLHGLIFDEHVFLPDKNRRVGSLEIPAHEVKNNLELAFDIPAYISKMLIEYRMHIASKVIGRQPDRIFVNVNGETKSQAMVALLIKTYLKKRAGLELTPHQFRHLGAKVVLDAEPGNYETVRQVLGHKNMKTTTNFYAGIDSRRASRHHQRLLAAAIAATAKAPRTPRRRTKKGGGERP
jgi:integrase